MSTLLLEDYGTSKYSLHECTIRGWEWPRKRPFPAIWGVYSPKTFLCATLQPMVALRSDTQWNAPPSSRKSWVRHCLLCGWLASSSRQSHSYFWTWYVQIIFRVVVNVSNWQESGTMFSDIRKNESILPKIETLSKIMLSSTFIVQVITRGYRVHRTSCYALFGKDISTAESVTLVLPRLSLAIHTRDSRRSSLRLLTRTMLPNPRACSANFCIKCLDTRILREPHENCTLQGASDGRRVTTAGYSQCWINCNRFGLSQYCTAPLPESIINYYTGRGAARFNQS